MVKVFLMGAGKGGKAVLSRLLRFDWVKVVGVSDINPDGVGILLAREARLPVFIGDPFKVLEKLEVDLVFELTGEPAVQARLLNISPRKFELITGQIAFFMWNMIQELEDHEIRLREFLGEHRILSEINVILSRSETSDQIFESIVLGGMRITGMPAGSLSIYNREKKELFLGAAKGFSSDFYKNAIYPVRPGGLTEFILSQNEPVLIPNIADYPSFNNPILLKEGIRSLVAVPLISEKEPVGILYNDDFKPRVFNNSIIETLRLLATQAVIAIQKQQAFEQIKNLSTRDPLTGLYNRRYLNQIFMSEMERAIRMSRPLSIIIVDIDFFKAINDQYGHLVGDQVLRGLAGVFGRIVRPYDTFARFGGEEFLILMPETGEDEAHAVAERLRESAFSEKNLPGKTSLTCSFGVSTLRNNEVRLLTPDELLHRADKALYRAKELGRNRVEVYHLELDPPVKGSKKKTTPSLRKVQ